MQAEDYNLGGEGVAYHDITPGNNYGQYRTDDTDDVDINQAPGGGYIIGWTAAEEWLAYTLNVQLIRVDTPVHSPYTRAHALSGTVSSVERSFPRGPNRLKGGRGDASWAG